jgi:hypothetical protein
MIYANRMIFRFLHCDDSMRSHDIMANMCTALLLTDIAVAQLMPYMHRIYAEGLICSC